jgi:hypothetical protein
MGGTGLSTEALVREHRQARVAFWRSFAPGVVVYALPLIVTLSLRYNDLARVGSRLLVFLLIWGIWAALAPRGAATASLLLFAFGFINVIIGSLILARDEGLIIMIPFATVAIPCDVFALAFIWAARPKSRVLVRARRELRHERRDQRIRSGGGM